MAIIFMTSRATAKSLVAPLLVVREGTMVYLSAWDEVVFSLLSATTRHWEGSGSNINLSDMYIFVFFLQ